jgi:hypothetical protein
LLSAPGVFESLVFNSQGTPVLLHPLGAGAASWQWAVNVITLPQPVLWPPTVTVTRRHPPGDMHKPLIVHVLQHPLRGTPIAVDDGHQFPVTPGHTIGQGNKQAGPDAWF